MSDIFREVDEELRQDKLRALWKKHGLSIIIFAAAIVVGVAGMRGYQAWDRSQAGADGARFSRAIELLREGEREEGRAILAELAADSYANYPVMARMREAAAFAEAGERDAAVAAYDAVAGDGGVDQMLRDVARVRAALILVDSAAPDEIQDRLGDLAESEGSWHHSARELIALSLYRAGDHAAADAEYDRIMADPAAPVGLRGRAEMMRALIAPHLATAGQ